MARENRRSRRRRNEGRSEVSDPAVSLDVTARPTSTFAPAPLPARSNSLLDLAEDLSAVEPTLRQLVADRRRQQAEEDAARAQAEVAKLPSDITSAEALANLSEDESETFRRNFEAKLGQREALRFGAEVDSQVEEMLARGSSPQEIESFAAEQFDGFFQGAGSEDAPFVNGAAPLLQEKQASIQRKALKSERERLLDRNRETFFSAGQTRLEELVADGDTQAVSRLARDLFESGPEDHGLSKQDTNAMLVEMFGRVAIARGDPELLDIFRGEAGGKLAFTARFGDDIAQARRQAARRQEDVSAGNERFLEFQDRNDLRERAEAGLITDREIEQRLKLPSDSPRALTASEARRITVTRDTAVARDDLAQKAARSLARGGIIRLSSPVELPDGSTVEEEELVAMGIDRAARAMELADPGRDPQEIRQWRHRQYARHGFVPGDYAQSLQNSILSNDPSEATEGMRAFGDLQQANPLLARSTSMSQSARRKATVFNALLSVRVAPGADRGTILQQEQAVLQDLDTATENFGDRRAALTSNREMNELVEKTVDDLGIERGVGNREEIKAEVRDLTAMLWAANRMDFRTALELAAETLKPGNGLAHAEGDSEKVLIDPRKTTPLAADSEITGQFRKDVVLPFLRQRGLVPEDTAVDVGDPTREDVSAGAGISSANTGIEGDETSDFTVFYEGSRAVVVSPEGVTVGVLEFRDFARKAHAERMAEERREREQAELDAIEENRRRQEFRRTTGGPAESSFIPGS